MKAISIIVPVYNVECYLKKCLDSICEQDFTDIQVICVDDCSTDNSYHILQQYEKANRFVEVYKNDVNMGLAYTRNVGLQHANGKYIMYVDSDDYLGSKSLSQLYEQMEHGKLDILFFDVQEFEEISHETNRRRIRKNSYGVLPGIELIKLLVKNGEMFGSVWDAIYRREYLEEYKISFINGILHEDIAYTFSAVINANRASCLNQIVYYYRQRNESILHNPNYAKLLHGLIITYAAMLLSWNDFLYRNGCDKETELTIMQYMDSIIHLMRSRYNHVLVNSSTDIIIHNFFENFSFNKKKMLQAYFEPDDVGLIEHAQDILIYGAGKIAKEVISILEECRIEIKGIYTTNPFENEQFIYGMPIESYEKIDFIKEDQCIIIATSEKMQFEIMELLQHNRFQGRIVKVKKD